MRKKLLSISFLLILIITLSGCGNSIDNTGIGDNPVLEPQVKKSTSGICHEKGSTYYGRTTNFTPFTTLVDCLNSGGRLPKK